LQENLEDLKKANVQVVAVSYDSVKILNAFGKQEEIRYPLLSDSDSKVIEAYGIRNKEMKGKRFDGVPYPGTFLIDTEGVIREKLFYEDYKKRHTAADVIKATAKLPKPKIEAS